MKHKFYLLAILFAPITTTWALTIEQAPIHKVTLYPNSALIERSIKVKTGEKLVTLQGLPANFDMNLLKVIGENVDISAVTHLDSALDKPSGRESSQLLAQIQKIQQQMAELDAQIQAAELQNKFLGNATTGNATAVRQQAYDAFLTITNASQQKDKLQQRLTELNQDIIQINDYKFNQRTLQFHVNSAQTGTIHLSYPVEYAIWRPSYKAELNSQTQKLTLTRMAMISQKTGEDWDNVQITLSTHTPQEFVQQIDPRKWWVNFEEHKIEKSANKSAAPSPIHPQLLEDARPPLFPQFQQLQGTFSSQFTSTTQSSIPSSSQRISVPLDQHILDAKINAWIIPQQQEKAFLSATTPRVSGDWPSGLIKLYRDGDYIGERQWQNATTEDMHFNFGEDQKITVKTIKHKQEQSQSGALSKSITNTQRKQYQITNLHRQAMDIVLFESIPVSQNTALTVSSQFSQTPQATSWQGQEGIYQWQQKLAPQQTFNLDINYQFKYPKDGYTTGF